MTVKTHRRELLQGTLAVAGVWLLSGCGVWPPSSQSARPYRIGYLGARPLEPGVRPPGLTALHQGLQELGYVEERDYVIEARSTDGVVERAPGIINELLERKIAVLYTSGTPNALAARQVTSDIPIVIATNGDLVAVGLISSLSRPGGNVTGVVTLAPQLSGKRLEILREMVPGLSRFGMLVPSAVVDKAVEVQATRTAAEQMSVPLEIATVADNHALPAAFGRLVGAGVGGLVVAEDIYYSVSRDQVVGLAARHRLPTIYTLRDFVAGGGLISYGVNFVEAHRRGASHVDKILRGAKPAELPVEQPTTFDVSLNLTTAQALGLIVPNAVLQQATEIIQ